MSACICGTRGSGVLYSTGDVLEMSVVRGVGAVCDMCMCLARGGVGGEGCEWLRELGLGFQKYWCVFYGSPLWPLEGAMIQSLCVDWRKALRCVLSVNNRTHCDIITSLSNQFPRILRLKKRFIKFISNCLVSQNDIVKIISQVAICNPMSNTDSNYRCTSDSDGKLSIKSNMNDWHIISDNVCSKIDVLHDLFNIREGNISCDGFTGEEINFMIYDICVH